MYNHVINVIMINRNTINSSSIFRGHSTFGNMPLGDWLKSWTGDQQPPEKPENVVVAESILMELDYQMKEACEHNRQKILEEKRKLAGGVDYSWLSLSKEKSYEIPQLERLELEETCLKVKPDECGRIILMFRDALVREPEVHEIPRIMRAVICQVLEGRPKEESMPEWVMRSITSLAKYRPNPRISPIAAEENAENCVSDNSTAPTTSGLSHFISNENLSSDTLVERIEELPV